MLKLLNRLFSKPRHLRRATRTVFCLELLERREVPATATWNNLAGGGDWTNVNNWSWDDATL